MSDFPIAVLEPLVTIHPFSLESVGISNVSGGNITLTGATSATFPVANKALFIPFTLSKSIVAVKLFSVNGATVSGNIDVGVYDHTGTRLVSAGSTLQAGTNDLQLFDIADTQIGPGLFYLAVAMDDVLGTLFFSPGVAPRTEMAEMAAAFALPATATLVSVTTGSIPLIGLTTRAVI